VGQIAFENASGGKIARYDGAVWRETETPKTVTSLIRVGTTATATVASHGYSDQDVIRIAGVAEAGWNDDHLINVTGTNTFTFPIAGSVTTPTTGTRTAAKVIREYPDILDSTTAAPNNMPYGLMAAGDLIGWWLFQEIRDMFNVMTLVNFSAASWNTTTHPSNNSSSSGGALSQAAAETQFTANITTVPGAVPQAFNITTGTPNYFLTRAMNTVKATLANPHNLSYTAKLFARLRLPNASGTLTYDRHGDTMLPASITPDHRYLIDEQAGSGTAYVSGLIGSMSSPNAWGGISTSVGYRMDEARIVLDFNVAGGFTYRP
jgi:hypothetical protein